MSFRQHPGASRLTGGQVAAAHGSGREGSGQLALFCPSLLLTTLAAVSLVLSVATVLLNVRSGVFGFDFWGTIWTPGREIASGRSPYPIADAPTLVQIGNPSVYPPPILLVALPLGLVSVGIAAVIWSTLSFAALLAAFAVAGLRDWRGYVLLAATPAVCATVVLGQMNGFLVLGCVLAWRYRDRAVVAGCAVAAVIAAKLFLAPVVVWLIATRRYRAAAIATGGAVVACIVSWAIIGFDGFRSYPALLAADTRAFEAGGDGLVSLALRLGLSPTGARAVAVVAGVGLVGLAVGLAAGADGDRRSFTAAVAAGIVLSPIVWLHYFVFIFVGLVLARPRPDLVWTLLFLTWISSSESKSGSWSVAVTLVVVGLILASNLRAAEPPGHVIAATT